MRNCSAPSRLREPDKDFIMEENSFKETEFGNGFDFKTWKKIFSLNKKLFPWLGVLAAFMIAVAVVDGIFPLMTRYAIDSLVPVLSAGNSMDPVWSFVRKYAVLAVTQGLNVFLFILIAGMIEVRVCHRLRYLAFRQLQKLSFSYYDKTPAGWIMSRMTSDAQKLGDTIAWGIVDLVWGGTMMIVIIIFMTAMHPPLAAMTLFFTPILLVATFWFQKKLLAAQRKARKANSLLSGVFNEGLQGARTSKVLNAEDFHKAEFAKQSSTLRRYALRSARISALFMPIVVFLAATGAAVALGAGGTMVLGKTLSFGTLVAFVNYAMMFFDPAREFARVLSEFQAAQASAERLLSLIGTEPEILDRADARDDGDILGSVELKDVSFHYGDGKWIFEHFSLSIPAGQTVAIVGETGCGKSTLVNILCRFYEPISGEVNIDGREYRERTCHWLHSRLGYVLQTPLLFSGTIRENIRYGRLDATDAEIEKAASEANAAHFIEGLEHGYETMVGEGGVLLSTGQKQLISLARALVADPRIMILDEATSSVDTETEVLVQNAVDRLLAGRTSVVIAHRLSTIRNADRIIVMDAGRVIEDGTHDELMSRAGRYRDLYNRQFLDSEAILEAAREEPAPSESAVPSAAS